MLKNVLITSVKVLFAGVLIAYLIQSGKLDLKILGLFLEDPVLLFTTIAYYAFASCVLCSWRWKTLLHGAGFTISWARTLQLHMVGLFFNSVIPGAVSGDIVKTAYLMRDNPKKSKAGILMTALLDRIVGLASLFLVALVCILINLSSIIDVPGIQSIFVFVAGMSLAFVLFFTAALWHYRGRDPFLLLLQWKVPGFSFIEKIYDSLRSYRYARRAVFMSMLISLGVQITSLLLFYLISSKVLGFQPPFGKIAAVFPIGVLTTAIPLTPGGLGVGHVTFGRLFEMVGLEHGANIFNIFVLSQLFLNILGIFPYISLRKLQQSEIVDPTALAKAT